MSRKLILAFFALSPLFLMAQPKLEYIYSADSIEKAIALHDEEKYDEAIRLYNMVSPGDTNYELAVYEKCLSLVDAEKYEEAVKLIKAGIAFKNSSEGLFYNLLGTSYDHLDEKEKAIDTYTKAIERFPMDHNLYYNRGVVYGSMAKPTQQLNDFKKAVEINPYHSSSHLALAQMALNEEQYAQSLLAAGFFLLLEPTTQRSNDLVVMLNNAVSDKIELKPKGLTLQGEKDFQKTNLLITSYAALRDDYKVPSDIGIPFTKQLHLAIDQSVKIKKRSGFWENYYLPFYDLIMKDDRFEPFSYRVLLSSGSESHKKIFEKHTKDIKELIAFVGPKIKELYGVHHLDYNEGNDEVKYWFFNNGQGVEAIGNVQGKETPVGPYTFYYSNGSISSEGNFNENGDREGEWTYYYPDGQISGTNSYKDGKYEGADIDYHENGLRSLESAFKAGERHGVTCVYNSTGELARCMYHKNGAIEDSLVYYHQNGAVERWLPIKAGLIEGKARYYRADGTLSSTMEWASDQRDGSFEFFHPNGELASKGQHKEGNLNEAYISYYPNGNVKEKGNYIDGTKVGRWEKFYYDGKKKEVANFDEKGKNNGTLEYFDYNGHKTTTFEYNRGEIASYKHFGREGNILHQDERKRGRFWYENYTLDGVKDIEGNYEGDHKEGLWKYYSYNGVLTSEEFYNEKGNIEGEDKDYHRNGKLSAARNYVDDTLTGYDISYHDSGQMKEQGYNWNGLAQGHWEEYYENGKMKSSHFYVDGSYNGPQYHFNVAGELYMIEYFEDGVLVRSENTQPDSVVYNSHEIEFPKGADTRYYPSGQKLYELHKAGSKYNGPAKWWYGTGQTWTEGEYLAGDRHGTWKWYNTEGKMTDVGDYSYGAKTGEWKEYHENGQLAEVVKYENGERHGEDISYYPDGKLEARINYFQGEMNGKRYFYDYEGNVDHIRFYDQGRIIGYSYVGKDGQEKEMIPLQRETGEVTSYFPNGQVSRKYKLDKGMFEGEYLEYNADGSLRFKCTYINDNRQGLTSNYFGNGKVKSTSNYANGLLSGEYTEYHRNGKVRFKRQYLNGSLHGVSEEYDETGKLTNKYEYKGGNLYQKI